ncbi:MAG TPA: tetratricopeptide repeat protein [Vicinamibacterales bacterium]|nr:tetratricopeptide repeat protein [Vicinamibacterales bacterium]HPK70860.1 tetratricopeptide repeat protein [Vicinamibacterales bacterium]
MKRTQRRQLKVNEFAEWLLKTKAWFEANQKLVSYAGVGVAVAAVALLAFLWYRQMSAGRAATALAEAMSVAEAPIVAPPAPEPGKFPVQQPGTFPTERARLEAALPKLLAVADGYPGSNAGVMAAYRAASALVALGRLPEAIDRYKQVAERSTGVQRTMARMGLAEAHVVAGQFDQAIAAFTELSAANADDVPGDGILMQLARAYKLSGRAEDAKKTFKRVVVEFPQSPYVSAARREAEGEGAGS